MPQTAPLCICIIKNVPALASSQYGAKCYSFSWEFVFQGWLYLLFPLSPPSGLFLPGGPQWGVFVGWGFERESYCEFYFGFWWIRKQGICHPVTQLYWNMMQTASIWSTEGAEKFFWGGLEISKAVFKEGLVSLENHPANNAISSPIHGPPSHYPEYYTLKVASTIFEKLLCALYSQENIKKNMLECGPSL